MVSGLASPPFADTENKSPWYENTMVSPSGEMAGYRIQSGLSASSVFPEKAKIKSKAKSLKYFIVIIVGVSNYLFEARKGNFYKFSLNLMNPVEG